MCWDSHRKLLKWEKWENYLHLTNKEAQNFSCIVPSNLTDQSIIYLGRYCRRRQREKKESHSGSQRALFLLVSASAQPCLLSQV